MIAEGDESAIKRVISSFAKETDQLVEDSMQLIYYMRGAVSYGEVMYMTPYEKSMMNEFISDQLEKVKNLPHPVF